MKTHDYDMKAREFEKEAPEEGRRAHRPKRYDYNNKDEDISPNNLDNKLKWILGLFPKSKLMKL